MKTPDIKIAEISVTPVDHMGSDLSVVNAARVSFDKESSYDVIGYKEYFDDDGKVIERHAIKSLKPDDVKLLSYLAKHNHWSPFSHAFASFRIKAPIFVARQLVKHQVGLAWNEVSRRYVDSAPELWFPDVLRKRSENAKQGSLKEGINGSEFFIGETILSSYHSAELYNDLLTQGVCPEQARMVLPQNTMTEWIWSGSLYAFARVCNLRLDSHAQKETQDVAKEIDKHMKVWYPDSWKVLVPQSVTTH